MKDIITRLDKILILMVKNVEALGKIHQQIKAMQKDDPNS